MTSSLYKMITESQGKLEGISTEQVEKKDIEASEERVKQAQNDSDAKHISLRGWVIRISYLSVAFVVIVMFFLVSYKIMFGVHLYANDVLSDIGKTKDFLGQLFEYFLVAASVLFVKEFSRKIRR